MTANLCDILGVDPPNGGLAILPTSIIDIGKQNVRKSGDHDTNSSRSEYSPFPWEIATLCCEFYLRDSTHIIDPFAGWGERHFYAKKYGKRYTGYDISNDAIKSAKDRFGVDNILADSRVVSLPEFDGFLTCPPYWDLEVYSGDGNLSKLKTWDLFLNDYSNIISRFYAKASPGTTFCIMVGDWRSSGTYYDLEYETCNIFKAMNASVVDKVVVSRKDITKIKIMLPQCKRLGYSVKVHENLLVFKKPT